MIKISLISYKLLYFNYSILYINIIKLKLLVNSMIRWNKKFVNNSGLK